MILKRKYKKTTKPKPVVAKRTRLEEIYLENKKNTLSTTMTGERKKLTLGNNIPIKVKRPQITKVLNIPKHQPTNRTLKTEVVKARIFLAEFLKFDKKENLLIAKYTNKNCQLQLIEHDKKPEKLRINNTDKTLTTMIFKIKDDEIYFWLRSIQSSQNFAKHIFSFILIVPPEPTIITVGSLERYGEELEEAGFQIFDLGEMPEYEPFFKQ